MAGLGALGKFAASKANLANRFNWLYRKFQEPGFADFYSGSNVLDPKGRPMPVFHGTTNPDISEFVRSESGALGPGIYITPNPAYASLHASGEGGNVIPLLAALRNPLELTYSRSKEPAMMIAEHPAFQDYFWTPGQARRWAKNQLEEYAGIGDEEFIPMLKEQGFDSVILRDPNRRIMEATALYPSQLKSAIGSGYSRRSGDIKRAVGGLARAKGN